MRKLFDGRSKRYSSTGIAFGNVYRHNILKHPVMIQRRDVEQLTCPIFQLKVSITSSVTGNIYVLASAGHLIG